ncbi:MAG TPA: TetR/AcrR family transcriptional regulator [Actinoplanes sp.]|nr:TetR/AcrR family transcriptional regulator [Actinoplanes sp.]
MTYARRATRERILDTAERLFGEHGVFSVSNRQISAAAGQGNNAAVGYHFGSKDDLVRAIVLRHAEPMTAIRLRLLDEFGGGDDVRDWVVCVVRPITEHLAGLGNPSWYARFAAQLIAEPNLRALTEAEVGGLPSLQSVFRGLDRVLPELSPEVRRERDDMAHTLILHFCARRERTLPPGVDVRPIWKSTETSLIDALEGLYRAPVSRII